MRRSTPHDAALVVLLRAVCVAMLATPAVATAAGMAIPAEGRVVEVDCDVGESLADALAANGNGTNYRVTGTCMERITMTADDVTIDGGGTAVIDAAEDPEGPVMHVDGARLTVEGLTVQNGRHGILVEHLASLELRDVVSRNNRSHGVEVINSDAVINGLQARENGRVGLSLVRAYASMVQP